MELIYQKKGEAASITLNRPEVLNALNFSLLHKLHHLLIEIPEKVVIITGSGDKAFAAGADIGEMQGMTEEEWTEYCCLGRKVFSILETGPFVTIAAVNGYAFGGGMELALACDLVLASETAQFGLPEVKLGVIPSFSGIPRLTRAIGKFRAAEWMLTGRSFTAGQAHEMGLINRLCPPDQLLAHCSTLADEIVKNGFEALLGVKKVMHGADEETVSLHCFAQEERKARMEAFLKRKKHAE